MLSDGPLTIVRDVDGVAHVRATTLADGLRGQGWAAAEDRIWQMELDRRRALGRLAEAVGPAGAAADALHRRLGLAEHARRSHDALGEEARAALAAYAEGVSAWVAHAVSDDGPGLPAELDALGVVPEPWEPWHSIALYEVRHLAMGTFEAKVWRSGLVASLGAEAVARLWPELDDAVVDPTGPDPVPVAGAPVAELAAVAADLARVGGTGDQASNNLAIAPGRTATGRPLLAGDPHRAVDLPNVYWQNHVTCDGTGDGRELDVVGLSFPGVPCWPHFGHNAQVAWCITHGMADDQDVLVVDLRRTADGVEARGPDGWAPARRRTEHVPVAGAPGVEVEVLDTDVGPVVTDAPAGTARAGATWTGLALRWTATQDLDTTVDALLPMARARDLDELDVALVPWVVPVNNLLAADVHGAVGYRMRGRLAVRGEGHDRSGWTAVPADDPDRAWSGWVADADLPRWRSPGRGFLVTANQRIDVDGAYVSHDFAHPTRARRLVDRLAARDGWDVDDVAELLGDVHSAVSLRLADRLLDCGPAHPAERRALGLLAGWDGHMAADSAAAALVGTARAELVRLLGASLDLAEDRLTGVAGPSLHQTLRFVNARLATWVDDDDLVPDRLLRAALRQAVRLLELDQGADPARWRWGASHTALFVHPLLALRPDLADRLAVPPAVPLGGDNECVRATSTAPPSTRASNGQVARYVFDVGDWDRSAWIVPHGVSGDARSAHHLDQLEDWAANRLRPMRWSRAAVDAATGSVTELG